MRSSRSWFDFWPQWPHSDLDLHTKKQRYHTVSAPFFFECLATADAAALKQCIMLEMGISILSKATVQADARQGKLLLFPLGEAAFLRKLYLVYSPVKYMAEEGGVFLEFVKRFYKL